MTWAPAPPPPTSPAPQYAYGQGGGGSGSPSAPVRELLSGPRTYYVRTDGSDSNNGLTNTAGGAFLTIQKAVNTCALLDAGLYQMTVQVGDGTYTAGASVPPMRSTLPLIIRGNNASPSNVHVNVTGIGFTVAHGASYLQVLDMKITASSLGLHATAGSLEFGNIVFGTAGNRHVNAQYRGYINALSAYTIAGGAQTHVLAGNSGVVRLVGQTITLTGTPAFSSAFATASELGSLTISGNTFSGSATGSRYSATMNSMIQSGGTTLPGSVAGTTASGGQYA